MDKLKLSQTQAVTMRTSRNTTVTDMQAAEPKFQRQNRLLVLIGRAADETNRVGTIWIFALMVLICCDILARTLLNSPIRGVAEIVGFSIVGIVFLQIGSTLLAGRITRADLFIGSFEIANPRAAGILNCVFLGLGSLVFLMIAIRTYPDAFSAWQSGDYYGARGDFTFPTWPIKAVVVFGSGLAAVAFASQATSWALAIARSSQPIARSGWIGLAVFGLITAAFLLAPYLEISRTGIGVMSVGLMLVLVYLGMHIGIALIVLALWGIYLLKGSSTLALSTLALAATGSISDYVFGVVPLFVLMGLVVGASGLGKDTFDVAQAAVGKIKGGLGIATVAANAFFAAITGVSIASAAIFTKVAVPEMVAHGYTRQFAVGVVAGSSVLGMLIPPSILLIVYGFLAEVSVGALFVAAAIPGLVLALAFSVAILFMARYMPEFVGNNISNCAPKFQRTELLSKVAPIVSLMGLILGGIYGGFFTPTEAGAAGAAGAFIIALAKRRFNWAKFRSVMVETGHVTVSILFLIIAASIYSRMLTLTGIPMQIGSIITDAGLGFFGFMLAYVLIILVMGTILDSTSIMLIVLPLVLPVVTELGGDLIWFGIVTVIAVEMGLLTPPLGISVYVVKASLSEDMSLDKIFKGALPFVLVMAFVTALLVLVPDLTTILL
ncbi:MAG: TRAP transporter large permease subunit [Pseudomonadota bacterium]